MTTPMPSETPSLEETLLTVDHLLGKMVRARRDQDQAMGAHLSRLESAIRENALGDVPEDAAQALATEAQPVRYCIQECVEWLRNHQHAAEQYLKAIQALTDQVGALTTSSRLRTDR